jgi:polar amino acid transport system permease protein
MTPGEAGGHRPFPYWLAAAAALGLGAAVFMLSDAEYRQILDTVAGGILVTIWVTVVAFALASSLGLLLAVAERSRSRIVSESARFYIEVIRGVPIIVLLLYIAFVAAPAVVAGWNWLTAPLAAAGWIEPAITRDFPLVWRAVLALTIAYSAFLAEIFRAGLQSVDRGVVEASKSLGLTRWQRFRLVVLPLALRTVLPPLGNDFVAMVKDSSLVSVLGVADVTQAGKVYAAGSFRYFETYNVVAFVYLCMTISLSLAVRALERRMRKGRG